MSTALGWLRMEPDVGQPPVRVWRDWVLAALVGGAALVEVIVRDGIVWRPLALAFGLTLAIAMLWRRSRPLMMVLVAFGTLLALDLASVLAVDEPFVLYGGSFVLVLVYALFRWGTPLQSVIGLVIVLMEWVVSVTTDFTGLTDAVGGLGVLLFPAALGVVIRYRSIVREQAFERVRLQERETLSRELHDTVAHHVSAIAIQAQAGRFLATSRDLDGAAAALRVIEKEASITLTEMRSMVGTLRRDQDTPQASVQHGVADIETLATTQATPGLRVEVELGGNLDDLQPSVQTALYRVVQESITNAQRHARHATRVDVLVEADTKTVRVSIGDDGERGQLIAGSTGYGLVGMAERVTLLRGTFRAGPPPDHGWIVEATIPRQQGAS